MTHPKRGYRFIAPVTRYGVLPATRTRSSEIVLAGTAGGGAAGLVGGLAYGVAATIGSDHGSAILAVLSVLTVGVALLGALGICTGMAAAARIAGRAWTFSPVGAAIGGFVTGELFHLLGTRSFSLLIGRAYDGFTGGIEGLTLGGAIALGAKLAGGIDGSPRRVTAGGALGGAFAGIVISLAGGQLMAASIAGLARSFKGSQLETGPFGKFADPGVVGSLGQGMITAGEGLLFGGCVVAAIMVRYRRNHG